MCPFQAMLLWCYVHDGQDCPPGSCVPFFTQDTTHTEYTEAGFTCQHEASRISHAQCQLLQVPGPVLDPQADLKWHACLPGQEQPW